MDGEAYPKINSYRPLRAGRAFLSAEIENLNEEGKVSALKILEAISDTKKLVNQDLGSAVLSYINSALSSFLFFINAYLLFLSSLNGYRYPPAHYFYR